MDFTEVKGKGEFREQKSRVTFNLRKDNVNSTREYQNISFIPYNPPTIKNEECHEYEVLRETTQLPPEPISKRSVCEQFNSQLICIILIIQVLLFLGIVAITVFLIISDSKLKQLDGSWNDWKSWGQCTVTCDYGMQLRNRTCSEQTGGKHCYGDATEYRICKNMLCQDKSIQEVNGGWSVWESWRRCSASCSTGMESRNRTCSNPKPSKGGDYCFGDSTEYQLCNKFACPGTSIGFSLHYPVLGTGGNSSSALKFRYIVENLAGAFNTTTGEFVCRQPGLYFFSTTVIRSTSITQAAYCYFYKNGIQHGYVAGYANDADPVYTSGTNAILYHLRPADTVSLRSCVNSNQFDSATSFTGFLVHADN